jgi:hypothetical protein
MWLAQIPGSRVPPRARAREERTVSRRRRRRVPPTRAARRALFLLPGIPDDADETLKNGLALRNACAVDGRCPDCGAFGELDLEPDEIGVYHLTFRHERTCGVLTDEQAGAA